MKRVLYFCLILSLLLFNLSLGAIADQSVQMETITVWSDNAHEKELRIKQVDEFNNTIVK